MNYIIGAAIGLTVLIIILIMHKILLHSRHAAQAKRNLDRARHRMSVPRSQSAVLAPGVQLLRDGSLEVDQVTPDRALRLTVTTAAIDAAADAIRRQGLHESPRTLATAALDAAVKAGRAEHFNQENQ